VILTLKSFFRDFDYFNARNHQNGVASTRARQKVAP